MQVEQKAKYQVTSFDLKDFSFLYYMKKNSRILIISVLNISLVLFNALVLCFAKNELGLIEAIGLVGMIEMMFIHTLFYGATNYCQYFDAGYMKHKSSYILEHNFTRALTDMAFYGFCVSILFLGIASGYITFMLPKNDWIRGEAITYILYIFPIIFLYAIITLSVKILSFIHKRHLSYFMVALLAILNMSLPAILFYCTNLGFDGIGLGTLLSFIIVTIVSLGAVLYNFYISDTKVIIDFSITFSKLKVAFKVTSIYAMSSFFKCSAMIALSLMGTNVLQPQQHLVMRVVLYSLMILSFGVPRGISQSLSYRLTKKHLAPADFIKYRKSIHRFYITYFIILAAYLLFIIGMYPFYIDLILMNNHDIVAGPWTDARGLVDPGINVAQAKQDLIGAAVLVAIFILGMSANYVYTPFLNALAKRSLNYWFAIIGIFTSCLLMYTLGIKNAGHFPYLTSIILPLSIFGVIMAFFTFYLYKREVKRTIKELNSVPVGDTELDNDIGNNSVMTKLADELEVSFNSGDIPINLNKLIKNEVKKE